jgi:peptide/nickel transport system permease protein
VTRLRVGRLLAILREPPGGLAARLLLRFASGLFAITLASSLLLPMRPGDSLAEHYVRHLGQLLQGDLGQSLRTGRSVTGELLSALPASVALLVLASGIGVALGAALALPTGLGWLGRLPRLLLTVAASTPIYALALPMLLVFWFWLGIMPDPAGAGPARAILPALTLALPAALAVARPLAFALTAAMRQTYFESARAASDSVFVATVRHGLRNALPGALAATGVQFGMGLANLTVVERLFGWPGLGQYFARALTAADRPAIVGVSLLFATLYLLVDIVLSAACAIADPRLR